VSVCSHFVGSKGAEGPRRAFHLGFSVVREGVARTDLRALFDEIPDPRVQRTRRHRLADVLVLVLLGTVVGCPGWDALERFGYEREGELRDIVALPGGIPSADTLRRVMAAVDPRALGRALTSWTDALCETFAGKQIAIDGKSIRRTLEAANGESALHVVNAWVCEHQMVLGQYATDVKSNEITAIPKLLELLALRGSTVTIDAMGWREPQGRRAFRQARLCGFVLTLWDRRERRGLEVLSIAVAAW
jgi:hypothetical protein